jgi:RNA-directed DNA polymerase
VRSIGSAWSRIIDEDTLRASALVAARGKRDRGPVQRFLGDLDAEIELLRQELMEGHYQPRPYTEFRITDPKPRMIRCADFRDRVVHHALCDTLGPKLDRRFLYDSYACRKDKGTHKAVFRAQHFARRYRYWLRLDIRGFYDSVDLDVCERLLKRLLREREVRELWHRILRHPFHGQHLGRGLAIGNLTSQWMANIYLDEMDHRIKENWRMPGYVRYMDDLCLWADDKDSLWWARDSLADWLERERGLTLKASATHLAPCSEGMPFLGVRVFPGTLRLTRTRYLRLRRLAHRRRVEFAAGVLTDEEWANSLRAMEGGVSCWGMKGLVASCKPG